MTAPAVSRLVQVTRNQGQPIPNMLTASTWVDVVALVGGTAGSYTLPTKGAMLRLTPTVLPTYGNFNGVAAAPSAGVINGSGSFPVGGQTYLVVPNTAEVLSFYCATTCYVTIEVWM